MRAHTHHIGMFGVAFIEEGHRQRKCLVQIANCIIVRLSIVNEASCSNVAMFGLLGHVWTVHVG